MFNEGALSIFKVKEGGGKIRNFVQECTCFDACVCNRLECILQSVMGRMCVQSVIKNACNLYFRFYKLHVQLIL